ncbi:endonuclease domain-containing protein [Allosphingosinicella humi]
MSPPETLLWQQLRRKPGGLKFRRQHPIEPYVVDFFCRETGSVVEIDGWAHDTMIGAARDEKRDALLRESGFAVLRIPADETMRHAGAVTAGILTRAGSPLHHAAHGPPPRSGEDI